MRETEKIKRSLEEDILIFSLSDKQEDFETPALRSTKRSATSHVNKLMHSCFPQ